MSQDRGDSIAQRRSPVKGRPMIRRSAIALFSLVLTLGCLAPTPPTLGATGGTDRPIGGTVSGTVEINVLTGAFAADTSGTAMHLGTYAARFEGAGGLTPQGTFAGTGTFSIAAADGDRLAGTFTLTGPAPSREPHSATITATIAGGTGRFANASGTLTSTPVLTPFALHGFTLLESADGSLTGQVSY
jgi:hypothetical protein